LSYKNLKRVSRVCKTWNVIARMVPVEKPFDMVFLCDITGSMGCRLEEIKSCVEEFMRKIVSQRKIARFGVTAYWDHDSSAQEACTAHQPLTTKPHEIVAFFNKLVAAGGKDTPEAVMDGLNQASCLFVDAEGGDRVVMLFADACPHGSRYSKGDDRFPQGCPCGLTDKGMLQKYRNNDITLIIVPYNKNVENMVNVFRDINPATKIISKYINNSTEETMMNIAATICS